MRSQTLDIPVPAAADEFADLVERHRKIVLKVAYTYCWREADRADLVQDILAELRCDGPRQRHTVPLDGHDAADPRDPDVDADVRMLYDVIDQLAPLDRALLLLHLDDHSHREIAGILGISESNVASKLNRLKLRLRRDLGARA